LGIDELLWLNLLSFATKLLHVTFEGNHAQYSLTNFGLMEEVHETSEELFQYV